MNNLIPLSKLFTFDNIKLHNQALGHHFFNDREMEAFGTVVIDWSINYYENRCLITKEKNSPIGPVYYIRYISPDGNISTIEPPEDYEHKHIINAFMKFDHAFEYMKTIPLNKEWSE